MIPPTKQGITLPLPMDLIVETERLILRPWRDADIAPNTTMLSDPDSARFITSDGKPVVDEFVGWRNAAI
jgi:RimJ/RimL family protein N-acetyltransferase